MLDYFWDEDSEDDWYKTSKDGLKSHFPGLSAYDWLDEWIKIERKYRDRFGEAHYSREMDKFLLIEVLRQEVTQNL